jgi:hypothetical protein
MVTDNAKNPVFLVASNASASICWSSSHSRTYPRASTGSGCPVQQKRLHSSLENLLPVEFEVLIGSKSATAGCTAVRLNLAALSGGLNDDFLPVVAQSATTKGRNF